MKFTPEDEAIALRTMVEGGCIVFPLGSYRSDGNILIYRDGLARLLHRYLLDAYIANADARLQLEPLPSKTFLLHNPQCPPPPEGFGPCTNPAHRIPSRSSTPRVPKADRPRAERKPSGGAVLNAAKTHCPANHPYTPENTYTWTDSKDRVHRKCMRCTILRTNRRNAAARAEREKNHG